MEVFGLWIVCVCVCVWQEELRKSIVSMVKQSVALNRPGAENMKPRQLSDTIHQEVGWVLFFPFPTFFFIFLFFHIIFIYKWF